MTTLVAVIAGVAWLVGYGADRLRPWRQLGGRAKDQVRSAGPWVRGGTIRQAAGIDCAA
ncbi:hypothetical protein KN815_34770 [Streptomyces sp. 4503]|uniref:Uncharacterized protein n=1 Tax=Streptomyces niphimycinicus TaxID=2842201 RepID=A0ABS6CQ00_9ACTN|nr:hypothetical protein [Streptomyces niphimycinicus]MBU3869032.1 hypothetical protein [Streptomyces niphimycinicus]